MPAKKKAKTKSIVQIVSWKNYSRDRDEFYRKHPWSRLLLGLFIVAFAIAIGVLYYNKNVIFIGLSLDQEGISYPYVEPMHGKFKNY